MHRIAEKGYIVQKLPMEMKSPLKPLCGGFAADLECTAGYEVD